MDIYEFIEENYDELMVMISDNRQYQIFDMEYSEIRKEVELNEYLRDWAIPTGS